MDDSQEPSYYEIALTNRQVLVFFVVLLLSVVGAFFSGVWLGQQRSGSMPTIVQAEAPEEPEDTGESLTPLNFFTDEKAPPSSAKAAANKRPAAKPEKIASEGSPGTTLLEDVGSKPIESPPATTSAPVAGDFVIQVFSSPDGAQARKMLDRMTEGGYEAFLSPDEVKGRTMYRVRIGPFTGRSEADSTAERLEKDYQIDTWVTRHE